MEMYRFFAVQGELIDGRKPRWTEVKEANGEIEPAPTAEAMDDCLALSYSRHDRDTLIVKVAKIDYWLNQVPCGNFDAVCYF